MRSSACSGQLRNHRCGRVGEEGVERRLVLRQESDLGQPPGIDAGDHSGNAALGTAEEVEWWHRLVVGTDHLGDHQVWR
jgi:hypothetical protein